MTRLKVELTLILMTMAGLAMAYHFGELHHLKMDIVILVIVLILWLGVYVFYNKDKEE